MQIYILVLMTTGLSSLLFSAKAWSPLMAVPVSKKTRHSARLLKNHQPYGLKVDSLEPDKWDISVKIDNGSDGKSKTVLHDRQKHSIVLTFAQHEVINDDHYLEFSISDLAGVSHMFLRTLNGKVDNVHICQQLGEILAANQLKRRNMPKKCPIGSEKPIRYQLQMNDEWWRNIEKHRRELMNKDMTFNVKLWKGKPCARCSSKSLLHMSIPVHMSSE